MVLAKALPSQLLKDITMLLFTFIFSLTFPVSLKGSKPNLCHVITSLISNLRFVTWCVAAERRKLPN